MKKRPGLAHLKKWPQFCEIFSFVHKTLSIGGRKHWGDEMMTKVGLTYTYLPMYINKEHNFGSQIVTLSLLERLCPYFGTYAYPKLQFVNVVYKKCNRFRYLSWYKAPWYKWTPRRYLTAVSRWRAASRRSTWGPSCRCRRRWGLPRKSRTTFRQRKRTDTFLVLAGKLIYISS